ncbi:Putative transcriptional regulator YwtF [Corynebacterium capitovis DSM 44611]|uniref:LCP family protein n=1 Tax=Corynebacterium capitovis TaxID=131081 RepID=UPI000477D0A6|nr:LCP family protein [Corynebacterium capitovis]WKD58303.1 Putative transcriptional regulator YwtF [Corynebacterium capitovis DSM 44611]
MPNAPHSNDPRDNLGEYVLGKDGTPIVDRYGRPVRLRRPGTPPVRPQQPRQPQRAAGEYRPRSVPQIAPRQNQPRQHVQPQQARVEPVPMRISRSRRREKPRVSSTRVPRLRPGLGCSGIFGLIVALLLALTLITDARLARVDALPDQHIANTAGTNWLLVGSDSRQGLSDAEAARLGTGGDIGSTRTDTIMLLHLPLTGSATLMSIPRDSYVSIPGYGMDKINAAFSYGGPQLLSETVEHATGLRVDRYAEIGMGGLSGVVDAIGGVEMCVREAIDDPLANINLQPGCQKMDGPTGLGYVRTRATAQGDIDRVQRQREFLAAIVDKVTSPSVLLNPFRTLRLAWVIPSLFTVGSGDHIWNLARIALAMRGGVSTVTVPVGGFEDSDVGSVILWDDAAAEDLFASLR